MNIESPGQGNNATERMMEEFIKGHPKYEALGFSKEEVAQAAALVNAQGAPVDEGLLQRALEARFSVRGAEGQMAVTDGTDTVIGVTDSMEGARKMVRKNNEGRDITL